MTKALKKEAAGFNPVRSLIAVFIVIGAAYLMALILPNDPEKFGAWAVVPAVFLIIYIFVTKRILESLVLASVIGFIMIG
ncbi:MAG: hypothetical protein PHV38_06050, partial [Eubacteriales bacterium]|nr:hypothetical protein [Eubacteriales bacterium]